MGVELFSSNSDLLMAWLIGLAFTLVAAVIAGLFPSRLEPIRKSAFAIMVFPAVFVALLYAFRGFGTLERPIVHWVFEKASQDSLHLGLVFDPLSFTVVLFTAAASSAICFRNRPSIRMSAALALSWMGIGLAVSAQTLWMAALGIGIQLLSRTFPLIEGSQSPESDDSRWIASTKRAWIGLASLLCGAAGLAAQNVKLDFFSDSASALLESTPSAWIAGGLSIFGLLVMAAPAFSSGALYANVEKSVEENLFVSETSLAWIAVIIFFRIFGNLHEASWLLAVGIGASVAVAGSLGALTFQTTKSNAIHLWLSTLPVATLMILPFIPAREASLYLLGNIVVSNGLWIILDHQKTKAEIAAAVVFFLGAFGFVGWSSSAGLVSFFSKFETDPLLRVPIFLLLLLYAAFGWRIVFRGGDRKDTSSQLGKWVALGIFFVIGFGPLLSGRWSGGAIPGEPDWIEGAKTWSWIKAGVPESTDAEWIGFAVTQGLVVLSAILGIFAWRSAELFPFSKKYPRGAKAAEGLFGLVWIQEGCFIILRRAGAFGADRVSARIWERGIPAMVGGVLKGFQKAGSVGERVVDPLTSNGYGKLFSPAAKLVQWLHGGNVRLYAWFTLIWILIFSIYLTR
jgi:hypothetical protein